MYIFQPDRHLLRKQIAAVAGHIGGSVLDVGAGERARYRDLFTCDTYTKMDVREGENVDVVGSADKIPFADNSFDTVLCTQVFEHLAEPFRAAGEITRVLKSGGKLVLTVPQVNELHEEPHDYFRYTKYGLRHLFEGVGLEEVSMEARGGYWSTLGQMEIRYLTDIFDLYNHPIAGAIASKVFRILGEIAFWFDRIDSSQANQVHTLGWCGVFEKSKK